MRQTFSILFFVKRNSNSTDKLQPIGMRITINGSSAYLSTGIKCCYTNWDSQNHKIKGRSEEVKLQNQALASMRLHINRIYYEHLTCGGSISARRIKDIYIGTDRNSRHLLAFFELVNSNFKQQVGITKSRATYQK